ncbi:MAG TPA: hypothetical protein VEQ35_03650 [Beijerinckia sp.]|nr:hypothetical protein [Beijerinckia sp.]
MNRKGTALLEWKTLWTAPKVRASLDAEQWLGFRLIKQRGARGFAREMVLRKFNWRQTG